MRIEVEPGVRLFVDIDGCGLVPDGPAMREQPTLILLHGGPGFDHSSFKPLFGQLTDVAQVVYVDHRGHGRSDRRPPAEWSLDTFADDVVRLCAALGIARPIVLGQSYGGFVAQRYLARHPAHPGKVILSSTSHHFGLDRKLAMFDNGARRIVERQRGERQCGEAEIHSHHALPLLRKASVTAVAHLVDEFLVTALCFLQHVLLPCRHFESAATWLG